MDTVQCAIKRLVLKMDTLSFLTSIKVLQYDEINDPPEQPGKESPPRPQSNIAARTCP